MVDLVQKCILWGDVMASKTYVITVFPIFFFVLEYNSLIHIMFEFWCQNQMSVAPNTGVKIKAKLPEKKHCTI